MSLVSQVKSAFRTSREYFFLLTHKSFIWGVCAFLFFFVLFSSLSLTHSLDVSQLKQSVPSVELDRCTHEWCIYSQVQLTRQWNIFHVSEYPSSVRCPMWAGINKSELPVARREQWEQPDHQHKKRRRNKPDKSETMGCRTRKTTSLSLLLSFSLSHHALCQSDTRGCLRQRMASSQFPQLS